MTRALTQSMQDYVKAIYGLTRSGPASTNDIARKLSVSAASVTSMIKKLHELKLVRHTSYRGVALSHAGTMVALEILRHHRLLELYLNEALGYAWDEVHAEAEKLEHHISEDFEDRIAKVLGDPSYDPHGDPIPTKDGRMPPTVSERLADANINESVVIRRVSSHDAAMLRMLTSHGLLLNTTLRVALRDADTGALVVLHGKRRITLDREITENIFIERL